jgi:hypothetical protein
MIKHGQLKQALKRVEAPDNKHEFFERQPRNEKHYLQMGDQHTMNGMLKVGAIRRELVCTTWDPHR